MTMLQPSGDSDFAMRVATLIRLCLRKFSIYLRGHKTLLQAEKEGGCSVPGYIRGFPCAGSRESCD